MGQRLRDQQLALGIGSPLHSAEPRTPLQIAGLALGGLHDSTHCLDHEHRLVTDRRFTRQHHCIGAIEHRIGNIAHFGSGGGRGLDHRLEHLCRRDHWNASLDARSNDPLLQVGYLFERTVDTKIAARHHHCVGYLDD